MWLLAEKCNYEKVYNFNNSLSLYYDEINVRLISLVVCDFSREMQLWKGLQF